MSSIRNPLQPDSNSNAAREQVTDGIVDNWLDNTAGTDDGDAATSGKQAHGKGGKGHIGKGHIGLGASLGGKDHVAAQQDAPSHASDTQQSDSSLPSHDQQPGDATSQHFDAIDHLVAGGSAVQTSQAKGAQSGASQLAGAGSISGAVSAASSMPAAVQTALTQLTQDLAATPPDTTQIASDTTTYMGALKDAGLSSTQIQTHINTLASDPSLNAAAASALVEAAKNGINTDDSNKDSEAQLIQQKQVDAKRNAAVAIQQQQAQQAAQQASSGGGNHLAGGSVDGSDGGSADQNVTASGASADESGDGQYGDVNVPANSKQYKGMTIEQLEASGGPVGQAIKAHPELVADIKRASAATGVPEGLLAGLCYMETTFGEDTATTTDADGDATGGVTQVQQSIVSAYVPGGSVDNAADNIMACAKGLAQFYDASGSWGAALRGWNSFDPTDSSNRQQVASLTDLTQTDGGGIGNYVSNILNYICEGKDAPG